MTTVRKQKRHFKIELRCQAFFGYFSYLGHFGFFFFFCSTGEVSYNYINTNDFEEKITENGRCSSRHHGRISPVVASRYCFKYYGAERNDFFAARGVRLFLLSQRMILLYCDFCGEVVVVSELPYLNSVKYRQLHPASGSFTLFAYRRVDLERVAFVKT